MNVKKLIEQINALAEEDIAEINLQDEIEPAEPAKVIDAEEPAFDDTMSLADQFDAKARIARALDALKDAVEEFKDATAEKVDLLKDQALTTGIESLDSLLVEIEQALAGGSQILGNSELNDPFKAELPEEPAEGEEEETDELEDEAEDNEDEEGEDEEDFDDAAGLDLFAGAEDEE